MRGADLFGFLAADSQQLPLDPGGARRAVRPARAAVHVAAAVAAAHAVAQLGEVVTVRHPGTWLLVSEPAAAFHALLDAAGIVPELPQPRCDPPCQCPSPPGPDCGRYFRGDRALGYCQNLKFQMFREPPGSTPFHGDYDDSDTVSLRLVTITWQLPASSSPSRHAGRQLSRTA